MGTLNMKYVVFPLGRGVVAIPEEVLSKAIFSSPFIFDSIKVIKNVLLVKPEVSLTKISPETVV